MPVNEIADAALVERLRQHMALAAAKQVVAASNIANVDTPGYRAQEVPFSETLDARIASEGLSLTRTNEAHLGGDAEGSVETRPAEGLASRRDGNNVQLDRELLSMARAGGAFAQAQTALTAKFRLVRYAINEGR